MAIRMRLSEIFQRVENAATLDEKRRLITNKYYCPELKTLLGHAFDPKVKFKIPVGETIGGVASTDRTDFILYDKLRVITVYTNSHMHDRLNRVQVEKHWIEMMGQIHPEDRKLMDAVKDKDLTQLYPSITLDFVKKCFPNFAKDWTPIEKAKPKAEVETPVKVEQEVVADETTDEKPKPKRRRGRPKKKKTEEGA